MQASVREFKARLLRYLKRAAAGERVIVTSRGRPIAQLTGLPETAHKAIAAVSPTPGSGNSGQARWYAGTPGVRVNSQGFAVIPVTIPKNTSRLLRLAESEGL